MAGNFVRPFKSAEEAWFWYCRNEERNKTLRSYSRSDFERPCRPDDVYIVAARLYISKRLSERHIRTMVEFGRRQLVPDPRVREEEAAALWWDDAMDKMEQVLRAKGVVAP
jgi:hypothetical protein